MPAERETKKKIERKNEWYLEKYGVIFHIFPINGIFDG